MSKTRTPFEILGVRPSDDMATIRRAWRAKVRRLHPDLAEDKWQATAVLAEVNAAFDALVAQSATWDVETETARKAAKAHAQACQVGECRAKTRRRALERSDAARRRREALARELEKSEAAKSRLKSDMGTINARAAEGYAKARRVVSVLQK